MAADDVEQTQKQTQCFEIFIALTNYKRLVRAIIFHRFCRVFHSFFDNGLDGRLVFVQMHPLDINLNTRTARIDPIARICVHFDDNISFGNLTDRWCSQSVIFSHVVRDI